MKHFRLKLFSSAIQQISIVGAFVWFILIFSRLATSQKELLRMRYVFFKNV